MEDFTPGEIETSSAPHSSWSAFPEKREASLPLIVHRTTPDPIRIPPATIARAMMIGQRHLPAMDHDFTS